MVETSAAVGGEVKACCGTRSSKGDAGTLEMGKMTMMMVEEECEGGGYGCVMLT